MHMFNVTRISSELIILTLNRFVEFNFFIKGGWFGNSEFANDR